MRRRDHETGVELVGDVHDHTAGVVPLLDPVTHGHTVRTDARLDVGEETPGPLRVLHVERMDHGGHDDVDTEPLRPVARRVDDGVGELAAVVGQHDRTGAGPPVGCAPGADDHDRRRHRCDDGLGHAAEHRPPEATAPVTGHAHDGVTVQRAELADARSTASHEWMTTASTSLRDSSSTWASRYAAQVLARARRRRRRRGGSRASSRSAIRVAIGIAVAARSEPSSGTMTVRHWHAWFPLSAESTAGDQVGADLDEVIPCAVEPGRFRGVDARPQPRTPRLHLMGHAADEDAPALAGRPCPPRPPRLRRSRRRLRPPARAG